jgi:hypothetical protein
VTKSRISLSDSLRNGPRRGSPFLDILNMHSPNDDHWLDTAPTFAACDVIHTVELRIGSNGMQEALSEIA